MIATLVVFCLTAVVLFAVVLIAPQVTVRGKTVSIYWMVPLVGAVVLLLTGAISVGEALSGIFGSGSMNPIKILVLFISMTAVSVFLDEVGFFKYLAFYTLKRAGRSQVALFSALYFVVAVLTVFTSNDIVVLTFTPFICYFCKHANVNPLPYLLAEFVSANTFSMMLIIGNPTNIYIASYLNIGFLEYLKIMWIPAIASGIVAYFVLILLFRKRLKEPVKDTSSVAPKIENKVLLAVGLVALSVTTVLLAVSSYVDLPMWLVAIVGAETAFVAAIAVCAVQRRRPTELYRTVQRAPWQLLPFVLSMFVFVLALEKYGVTDAIARVLKCDVPVLSYGFSSILAANVLNNIPMSVLFGSVVAGLDATIAPLAAYATVIGSNIGAYLTPIGALAGIMWLSMLKENGIKLSFGRFFAYGLVAVVPTALAAFGGLQLAYLVFGL